MRGKIVVILVVAFAIAAGVSSYLGRQNLVKALDEKADQPEQRTEEQTPDKEVSSVHAKKYGNALLIKAEPVLLNVENPAEKAIGELTYIEGWSLTSDNEDFGGWSGLVMKGDTALVAINDQGNWLQSSFSLNASQPFSASELSMFDVEAEDPDKSDYDAESLVALDNAYLVGFEQEHRIMRVAALGANSKPELYDTGVNLSGLSDNSGIEAMTKLADGRLIMFAENGRNIHGQLPAWITGEDGPMLLDFVPPENYSPTDAATLPDGSVLLLMRHFSVLDGASAKILHLSLDEINSGIIRGREIAELKAPYAVDNMEGLDVLALPDGTIRLFLISDDNFNFQQRTLFMVFDWKS